jgi:nucleoside-diphosphate-sugar epimerase
MIRILIAGAGDVACRLCSLLRGDVKRYAKAYRIYAVVRRAEQTEHWRRLGVIPITADLDNFASLRRVAALADRVLYLAPPIDSGSRDLRVRRLLAACARPGSLSQHWVYLSTTGVYGDRDGAWIDETAPIRPQSGRAARRVDAERAMRRFGKAPGRRVSILRVPGIYAGDRLPIERLRRSTPAIVDAEDSYTNHIHADDLARVILTTLRRGRANRVYHAVDDSQIKMGAYFDLVADAVGLPRLPRISRRDATTELPPALMSFMAESRRLGNRRLKEELKVKLQYPQVTDGLRAARMTTRQQREE